MSEKLKSGMNNACKTRFTSKWKPFPIKKKGSKVTGNETKESVRNPQKDTVNEACGLNIPTN